VSFLSALRPGHWIGVGLVAALIATGAWTDAFGLLGGNSTEAKQLTSCLERHGVNMTALVTSVGNPATLLRGAKDTNQVIHQAAKRGKIKNGDANLVMTCLHHVAH
jgi:hypothetical protein